jgi:hypothetical protein
MEAKAKADQEAQGPLPPPPFKPLAKQSFMQYMQFMQETQNKFMQELLGQVGAGRVSEARGVSLLTSSMPNLFHSLRQSNLWTQRID